MDVFKVFVETRPEKQFRLIKIGHEAMTSADASAVFH